MAQAAPPEPAPTRRLAAGGIISRVSIWFRTYGFAEILDDLLIGAYPLDADDVAMLHWAGVRRVLNLTEDDEYRRGEREVVTAAYRDAGVEPPTGAALYGSALAFDMALNGAFYAACALGDPQSAPVKGAMLGLIGGVANLFISPALGLDKNNFRRTPAMTAMTVAWYTAGGLAAGAMYRLLSRK